jgi:hypothetical protein
VSTLSIDQTHIIQISGYEVPTDPMDDLQCESCQ